MPSTADRYLHLGDDLDVQSRKALCFTQDWTDAHVSLSLEQLSGMPNAQQHTLADPARSVGVCQIQCCNAQSGSTVARRTHADPGQD